MSAVADERRRPKVYGEPVPPFEIFRKARLYLGASVFSVVTAGILAVSALTSGVVWLWAPVALLVLLALVALPGIADSGTPIFVADEYGVRLHQRDNWVGMLWREISEIVVVPGGLGRDARIRVTGQDGQHTYVTPVGFTTTVSVAEAEVELARRRATASY